MQEWAKGYHYFDIPKQERDSAIAFLLDKIAEKKTRVFNPQKPSGILHDVDVYLAHLLFAAALPDYDEAVKRYISTDRKKVADLANKTEDRVVQYFIYKVNADNILIHLSLLHDLAATDPGKMSELIKAAKEFYEKAAELNKKIYRRRTAIGGVLARLAENFDAYSMLLDVLRADFFHFANEFSDDEFHQFCKEFDHYDKSIRREKIRDEFLDAYHEWLHLKNDVTKSKVERLAREMELLDPQFKFSWNAGEKS